MEGQRYLGQRRRARNEIFSFAIPEEQLQLLYRICNENGMTLSQIGREALLLWLVSKEFIPPQDLPKHLRPLSLQPCHSTQPATATGVAESTCLSQGYSLTDLPIHLSATLPPEYGIDSDIGLEELARQLKEDT